MCDGERMFVESCPGGTVWDDFNRACVWPDMQTTTIQPYQPQLVSNLLALTSSGKLPNIFT
jgi:hypothetical protein